MGTQRGRMDNLDNISTVDDLLNIQVEEKIVDPADNEEKDEDFEAGQELLDQIRELRPDIWMKIARRLVLDTAELHRDLVTRLTEDGKHDKALGWAYDTSTLEMAARMLAKVKL